PVNDLTTGLPLLQLPAGFSYKSYGWTGDPMANGKATPGSHDGMAVITTRKVGRSTEMVLVRNHERSTGSDATFFGAPGVYDNGASVVGGSSYSAGGTTNLTFRDGQWIKTEPSLGGTRTNCAGGLTPWGTWLTCEEVGSDAVSAAGKKHGYVFEVTADPLQTTGQPIIGMGRFAHEAAGVDPVTGIVYLTEDSGGKSGFYRYVPTNTSGTPGSLALGGTLQMAKVVGQNNVSVIGAQLGDTHALEWVTIANPDQNRGNATGLNGQTITNAAGPFVQGWQQGALRMNRGEGVWYFEGKLYVMDTSGGPVSQGTIWELDLATQVMVCIYSSPSMSVGTMGDNITVSPRGGLLICEDGGSITDEFGKGLRLMSLHDDGKVSIFAKNNINTTSAQMSAAGKLSSLAGDHRDNEFCGACFDPTGRYLFVNIQTPGVTFAITGPWANGSL
ncbi:MAG TPA: alkaline phosphatase PhoX, partial [Aquabacterium sp.]|uniref:PhoX family protein n=1 Tax=Aquabacterium sp. TaxID=1872578 RepID=UPI002E3776A2